MLHRHRSRRSRPSHRSSVRPRRRRLQAQALEQRHLLAGDVIGDATPITIGSTEFESIDPFDEVDMYSVGLVEGDAILIDVDLPSFGLDSFVRVFDDLGNELEFSDDDVGPQPEFDPLESFVAFVAPYSGTFYIGISDYLNDFYDPITSADRSGSGSFGDYELTVDFGFVNEIFVDTTADDTDPSTTSLRDAIEEINSFAGDVNIISFDIPDVEEDPITGRMVIEVTSPLPEISVPVAIQGFTQSASNFPPIQIDGSALTSGNADGLRISADGVSIDDLAVANFPGDGIEVVDADFPSLDLISSFDNGGNGIRFSDVFAGEIIGSEFFGNGQSGIQVSGAFSTSNAILFNNIGGFIEQFSGTFIADGNASHGVLLQSSNNFITGNTISGNARNGISVSNPAGGSNRIIQNQIGTNPSGTAAVPNGSFGVLLKSPDNELGVSGLNGNIISGNARSGVVISGPSATGNTVVANSIGTDASGTVGIPNGAYGVLVTGSASGNTIGGGSANDRNVVSGNSAAGIALSGNSSGNTVAGNYVGIKSNGVEALGNGSIGVYLRAGANNNQITNNFIAGNPGAQISLVAGTTTANTITGNFIGFGEGFTRIDGGSVAMLVKSPGNTIGGTAIGQANFITGSNTGISLSGLSANNNTITGNLIGTDAPVDGNPFGMAVGVQFVQGARNNVLGPDNVIAYNSADAVRVSSTGGEGNQITENSMYANGFGIDLGPNGFTPNDSADGSGPADDDEGPNRLQNGAVSLVADGDFISASEVEINLDYFVDSDPAVADYPLTIEFFLSDPQGQGLQHVSTDTFFESDFLAGFATHSDTINIGTLLFPADFGTATVTDASGNTSEFTPAVPIDIALPPAAPPLPPAAEPEFDVMDVNRDFAVTARDALVVINSLSNIGVSSEAPGDGQSIQGDVNGDGTVSARDALAIINRLARDQAKAVDALFSDDDEIDGLLDDEIHAELF